ncbi:MAG: PDZ domain-containing protein [Promethearchaeota archaeon]|jgi:hypothetical protein
MKITTICLGAFVCLISGCGAIDSAGGWLGVAITPESGEQSGIVVGFVVKESPAYKAGLEEGDVLLAFHEEMINSSGHAMELIASHKPGDIVEIMVLRDFSTLSVVVELGSTLKSDNTIRLVRDPGAGCYPGPRCEDCCLTAAIEECICEDPPNDVYCWAECQYPVGELCMMMHCWDRL